MTRGVTGDGERTGAGRGNLGWRGPIVCAARTKRSRYRGNGLNGAGHNLRG